MSTTRRSFLTHTASATLLANPLRLRSSSFARPTPTTDLSVFTKMLQSLSHEKLGQAVAELGFRGVELPVRKRGHVVPERAADELPKVAEALEKAGVEITLITTDLVHPEDPHAESVLRTAAKLGIKRYRAGWLRYQKGRSVRKVLAEHAPRVRELAAFNRETGMQGVLQNHSGAKFVGSAVWDYAKLLEGVDPDALGVAFDLAHATIEGGKTWPNHVDLIWPHVRALYVKDFVWRGKKTAWVPFGKGNVDKSFYRQLHKKNFDGPISLHIEYEKKASVEEHMRFLARDRKALAAALARR